jgi:hypothetical protein
MEIAIWKDLKYYLGGSAKELVANQTKRLKNRDLSVSLFLKFCHL